MINYTGMSDFKILRHLGPVSDGLRLYLLEEYLRRRKSIDPDTNKPRADVVDPATGWVDSDLPRDEWASSEIVQNTVQFALGDPLGRLVPDPQSPKKPLIFRDFQAADRARRSARLSFATNVEVEHDEPQDEAGDGENLAGTARRQRSTHPS